MKSLGVSALVTRDKRKDERMDPNSFDTVTRSLSRPGSRRVTLRLIAGSLTAGILASRVSSPSEAAPGISNRCHELSAVGDTLCGLECVNLATNPVHCGACCRSCQAEYACQDGVCVFISYPVPVDRPPEIISDAPIFADDVTITP